MNIFKFNYNKHNLLLNYAKFVFSVKNTKENIMIPYDKLTYNFSRASGPGGQNVNKVNSKVEIRLNIDNIDWLNEEIKTNLKELFKNQINNTGELLITCQENRTQIDNKKAAQRKLKEIIDKASEEKKERVTGPIEEPEIKKEIRLKEKKIRSDIKKMRNERF